MINFLRWQWQFLTALLTVSVVTCFQPLPRRCRTTKLLASNNEVFINGPTVLPKNQVDVKRFREMAFRIAWSFTPKEFKPATPLLANPHVQTISGAVLREEGRFVTTRKEKRVDEALTWETGLQILSSVAEKQNNSKEGSPWFWDQRERIHTPDGDFFHVDHKHYHDDNNDKHAQGLVIILHGLQSSSNSTLVMEMATAFGSYGFDVACINFRGCSGVPNDQIKAYHLGFTDDLKQYLSILKAKTPEQQTPIFICGKSLGANVVMKALGELGMSAFTDYNVYGAAVTCVPLDNQRNANFLLRGFSKVVYNRVLLKSLQQTAVAQLQRLQGAEDANKVNISKITSATTISEFDDAFVAPLFGFQDYLDYYNKTSCLNVLDNISVPTLVFNSADDPFMDPDFFPLEFGCDSSQGQQRLSPLKMVRSDNGGHLGYLYQTIDDAESQQQVSFMPSELARFIYHTYERRAFLEKGEVSFPSKQSRRYATPPNLVFSTREANDLHLNVVDEHSTKPDKFQESAFRISGTFTPREFRPSPKLTNCHLQTISGVFLRSDAACRYVSSGDGVGYVVEQFGKLAAAITGEPDLYGDFWDNRQRIATPDGDFFHVDYKYTAHEEPSSKGLVILLHGLQSNSNSSLSVDLGRAYHIKGFDVACLNFRGCSGVPNNSLRAYHLGFTDDLMHYLTVLNSTYRKPPPIFISGFSLGANVVLKALGEMGSEAFEKYNVYGAAVSGAPFDNERNINCVQKAGFNKLVYNGSLLKSMKKSALSQLERFAGSEDAQRLSYEEISEASEISAFENAVIAPLFGFDDNVDYYRKTSCIRFLDRIRVPTFILNAGDDPFFDPDFFPAEKGCDSPEGRKNRSPVKLVRTAHGGHLGYMFHCPEPKESELHDDENLKGVSFMPAELARFLQHVWERRASLEEGEIA